jgi:hypothetical protein
MFPQGEAAELGKSTSRMQISSAMQQMIAGECDVTTH